MLLQARSAQRCVGVYVPVVVLHSNLFQRFLQKKRAEGKPYKVALIAAMHKMVHVIHSVWINSKPFVDYTIANRKEA